MHQTITALTLLFCSTILEAHYYKGLWYPSLNEARIIAQRAQGNVLDICCNYPEAKDVQALQMARASQIIVNASHFPTQEEMRVLESMGIAYKLILDDVFPSAEEIALLNKSSIQELHILLSDFPTDGEIEAFNLFTVPTRIDFLPMRLPRIEEMDVIKGFNTQITVGFYNHSLPGPGYADFFNELDTNKVFVVIGQFPWGIDAQGFNLFTRSTMELDATQRLLPQDVVVFNQLNVNPTLILRDIMPMTGQWLADVKSIKAKSILVQDNGSGELLNESYRGAFQGSKAPVSFMFSGYFN